MSDKNLTNEVKRLNAIIRAVERQRDEALTARAHADATTSLMQEVVRESQANLNAANGEIASLKMKIADLEGAKDEKPSKRMKAA